MGACDDDRSQAPSVADDEATTEEHEDTVDPNQEQQDIWAQAEGYTPLSDIHYTSLMVSIGPDDDNDDFNSDEDDIDRTATSRGPTGSFFVNPSAFTGTAGDGESNISDNVRHNLDTGGSNDPAQSVIAGDFDDIADKALSLLDEEYTRTLQGEHRSLSWEDKPASAQDQTIGGGEDSKLPANPDTTISEEEKQDMKVIAQAFDKRKAVSEKGSFVADWANLSPTPRIIPKKPVEAADTDAVRKVVQALSEKADNPFQQKFEAWQERQHTLPPDHSLIPQVPYKAFRRNTEKAKQATASLTRSATLAEALILLQEEGLLSMHSRTLLIDVVGVDHVECESTERIQSTFRPIIRWIGAWKSLQYDIVHMRLIGRDLTNATSAEVNLLTPQTQTLLKKSFATCHSGNYHEWLDSDESTSMSTSPHLAIAYNAGIWGYTEWPATIQYLSERKKSAIPMVITAYTLEECQEDFEVIQTTVQCSAACTSKILWEAQRNQFGSKVIRETKSSSREYRENSSWQAWLLGGNSSK